MPQNKNAQQPLTVADFTESVAPLLELINAKLKGTDDEGNQKKFCISDVVDKNGKRYVDLVLEGGGVLGIALAGYTYVLEKMEIAFMKMAGTSAGSINTLLLNSVTTKAELKLLKGNTSANGGASKWDKTLQYDPNQLDEVKYYDTRSEKILEYLSRKNLGDLVDGNLNWRKILLNTFQGKVDFHLIKGYLKKLKIYTLCWLLLFLFLFATGTALAILGSDNSCGDFLRWACGGFAVLFIIIFGYLLAQAMKGRLLYKVAPRFGINPGDDFEHWVQKILVENGINNVSQLKSKLQQEFEGLKPEYSPCCEKELLVQDISGDALNAAYTKEIQDLIQRINRYDSGLDLELSNLSELDVDDDLDDITRKLISLAEKINPDATDRKLQIDTLLGLFTKVNKLRYNYDKLASRVAENGVLIPRTPFGKEIAMVASDLTNQIKVEFPAMHKMYWGENFDISPAKYVRASMSIPIFFKPFQVDYDPGQKDVMEQEWNELVNMNKHFEGNDKYALMVDGGLLSNFPVNIFSNPDNPVPLKPTIGIKLEFEDDAKSTQIDSLLGLGGSMVSTMRYFYDRDFIHKHNIFKKTVRSIDTGQVNWLNFALSDQEKVELFFRGALTAAIFLLGGEEKEERARYIQHLKKMGSKVSLRGSTFSIYPDDEHHFFQTEDNNLDDVCFEWCRYKEEGVEELGELKAMRKNLKIKAGFNHKPRK